YVTDDGAVINYSIKLNGNGELFSIDGLGALTKGLNQFSLYIKGEVGSIITVQFGAIGSAVFTITDSEWNQFSLLNSTEITTLSIPTSTNFIDITATASSNTEDIYISDLLMKEL
ncbi:unnamed protein product, partial [marine sediment metagenome]